MDALTRVKKILAILLEKIAMMDDEIMGLFDDEVHEGDKDYEAIYVNASVFEVEEVETIREQIKTL